MKKTLFCLLMFFIFFITSQNAQVSASEEYIVEKNDTLWDISTRKLEDAFLWPKLWNVNPHIENPDLIYPGTKILIPSREELMQMPALPSKEIPTAGKQKVEISEPKHKPKSEPKSIWKYAPVMQRRHIIERNLFIASGWISDTYPSIGEIISSPTNQLMNSKNDIVYLKLPESPSPEKPSLIISGNDSMTKNLFFAIRDVKIVKHPVSGKRIGHQIRVTGILEVIGTDGDLVKARITDSFEDVQIGDGLLPYRELEPPLIPDTVRTPDIQGYIIESHMNSYLVSEGNVVFLDKGENDGIKVGDVFTALRVKPAESAVGKIQIVSLQPSTSGAVILQNSHEITIGTKWGQK